MAEDNKHMVTIRQGNKTDIERVNDYYESRRRSRGANDTDILLLAEDEDAGVVGVVVLRQEQGYRVLRGMDIRQDYRRQGLGARMLNNLERHMRDQDCYCLPYAHLIPFYRIVGFEIVSDTELPDLLKERLTEHHHEMSDARIQQLMQDDLGVYPPDGLKFIAMKRPRG
jgi:N-acetylglutamate synthase-like GNAT family acetyltransferase